MKIKHPLPEGRITYDLSELAKALGVSVRTLQREAKSGALKTFHIRTRAMVTVAAVEKYLKKKESEK
jgi:predicted site-specific integrase-resolvase